MKIQDLPQHLEHDLCKENFRDTYTLDPIHSFVDNDLTVVRFDIKNMDIIYHLEEKPDPKDVRYRVEIVFANSEKCCVTCIREFRYDEKLHSTKERGRIAYRFLLSVDEEKQHNGIASGILAREESIVFRNWKAKEIHVLVNKAGFKVWTKRRYGYEIAPYYLLQFRHDYCRKFNVKKSAVDEIKSLRDFPQHFWDYISSCERYCAIFYKPMECSNG
jgi:hypothetical protein